MPDLDLYNFKATVIRVIDGDTIDATVQLGFYLTATLRLRLMGVDTPEMRGPDRVAGIAAKLFVTRELLGREVRIHTEKSDVFGRWLALVQVDGVDFNQRLIAEGHAVPFLG